jgi:LuxR family transcriptional regulator, maltose regulon positive regulatory protein
MPHLLATKLYKPNLPPRHVERARLVERLTAGMDTGHKLTLLSAPAGFGKTICAVEWLEDLNLPIAWLSLDSADDEPGRFFTYLLGALQGAVPGLGNEIESVMRAGQLPPVEVIAANLIDGMLAYPARLVLVLDDFHHIQERSILQVFERLLANLPTALHLVLLTREDPPLPLARLRAHNQLTELRAVDLAFTRPEIDRFLSEVLGLSLSEADRAALSQRTEGWVAGLQLAGLSLRDRPDPSRFIANLSGSHRFILSYLTEEVLNQQPQPVQQFLLQTALLDRLTGDLCSAVTGRSDSQAMLEELYNANLFLVAMDDEGHWYRYHHLFAGLLRDRHKALMPEQTASLEKRAARWYAEAANSRAVHPNEQAALITDAIQHALSAADYGFALQLIETHAAHLLHQWYASTVRAWLEALPPEWSSHSPRASLAFVWMYLMRADFTQATPYIERLNGMFTAAPSLLDDPALRAEWLALQSTLLNAQGMVQEGLELARQALAIAPEGDASLRSEIYLGLASAYQKLDDYPAAVDAYRMIVQHGRAAGNLSTELLGISVLGLMAVERGQLHLAYDLVMQAVQRIEASGQLPPIGTAIYGELGVIQYHWHQLAEAEVSFERSTQMSVLVGFADADLYHRVVRARLLCMQGELEAAANEIQVILGRVQAEAPIVVLEEIIAQQVRIDLARGRLSEAEKALKNQGFMLDGEFGIPAALPGHAGPHRPEDLPVHSLQDKITHPVGLLFNSALRVLFYRAESSRHSDELQHAAELAGDLIDAALRRQYLPLALDTLLLRAQIHAALKDSTASRQDILRALELAEPEGFISIFLENGRFVTEALHKLLAEEPGGAHFDYIRTILSAGGHPQPTAEKPFQSGLIEPLTSRELEVLQLIAQGLTYNEIAAELVVSINTVRTHVKALYGKLGVDNRTRAIELAHQYHIL